MLDPLSSGRRSGLLVAAMLLVVVALVNAVTTGSELLFLGDDTWEWVSDPEVNQVGATVSYERYRHYFDGTTDIPQMGSRSWT